MIETPIILPNIPPFDATEDYEMKFYINTDSQIVENHLIIEDNLGREVYNKSANIYVYSHIIPANILDNGGQYKAKIKVRATGKGWSEFSPYELFVCQSPATVVISNIDYDNGNKIYNQNFTFKANYKQEEGDTPSTYIFKLYDKSGILLKSYGDKVYTGAIEQYVEDLKDGETYYIEVEVTSNNGSITNSGKVLFIPSYEVTSLSAVLDPIQNTKEGAIDVRSRLTQIKGKVYDKNGKLIDEKEVEFVDDEYLDLNREDYDRLVFDEGLLYDDNSYTIKIWLENIKETTPYQRSLVKAYGSNGETNLYFYNNRFHIFKSNPKRSNVSHYASNEISDSKQYMVQFSSNMGFIDLIAKEV